MGLQQGIILTGIMLTELLKVLEATKAIKALGTQAMVGSIINKCKCMMSERGATMLRLEGIASMRAIRPLATQTWGTLSRETCRTTGR